MNSGRNASIQYSKIMILFRVFAARFVSLKNSKLSTFLSTFVFLILFTQCSGGDKKLAPNESASGAGRSAYSEDEPQNNETEESNSSGAENRSASADPNAKPTQGCIEGDCASGIGTYIYDNGDEYRGAFQNDLRNGSGRIKYANGDKFDGTFKDDLKEGKGTYIFKNGALLEGTFQAGAMMGPGKVRFPDTSVYEGDFQDERNSAEGTMSSSFDGSKQNCRIQNKIVLCGGRGADSPYGKN
ncbi:MORN repeat-containing protein [Leptospira adleri]|uniref:MORN repeat protein n=1 Tax=Leptospira adleri TaxID=2023186 RepID=A0A2M9YUJ6_9LEPT|nr:hypothetical protein [Leptospira adleri]PJZ55217.1 hypothetical protein CH380_01540 [Leptospira adleri]PJZ63465.1 hypothetical protein CH376_02885 [Leptospira adleri]